MRVLIATAGKDQTEIGIRQLSVMAQSMAVEPTVLTVIRHAEDRHLAEAVLAHATDLLEPSFETVQVKTRVGHPIDEILREAGSGDYDLLMIGPSQSHSLLSRIRGTVAQKVVRQAKLPVLIAKQDARPFGRLLLCDSGVQTHPLLEIFREHAPEILAQADEVTILHVMSQIGARAGIRDEDLTASAEELIQAKTPEGTILRRDLLYLEDLNLEPQPLVRHGLVVDEITDEAREGDYDLVVIGAHREEARPHFLLENMTQDLVSAIDRSILILQ